MMKESVYQEIFNILSPLLPSEWKKLILYVEYGVASYNMSFYVRKNDSMIKCYDLPNLKENEILKAYAKIDEILQPERTDQVNLWTNFTMVVEDDDFKVDFDYTDLSSGSYGYKKEWKKRYIEQ